MKNFLFLCSAILFLNACGSGQKDTDSKADKNYEKSKESLEQIEQKNPTKFIKIEGNKKKNLLGQTVVKGEIYNNAKMITYKDVEIKISFYSKTGAVLEEDIETIYDTIIPGGSVNFKSKFFTPKGTDSVGFKILEAKH
jgi:hypothetical protein